MASGSGKAKHALIQLLERYNIALEFPSPVKEEVQKILHDPGIDDPALEDLTALPFITIDYADSRDLDQAMHIERGPGGSGFIVRYALADGAYFVRPGMALFEEALARGVSYYLPSLVVPMLPFELSEGIVSLNPGVDRRALVFEMALDERGRAVGTTIIRGRIHSRAKLTYEGVQLYHDDPQGSPLRNQPYSETLDLLKPVGELRLAQARKRDVVNFIRDDVGVQLSDENGKAFVIRRDQRNDVNCWNEQISLLCNIEGARLLVSGERPEPLVQPVYRIHEAPEPESLEHLEKMIDNIILAHDLDPQTITWRHSGPHRESLADYLDRLRSQKIERRLYLAIERQALLTNQRSRFSTEPGQHYALGVKPYSRFSAPMREIVGIFTHKEALEMLGLDPPQPQRRDEQLRDQVINAANRSKERQRILTKEVNQLALEQLLQNDLRSPANERSIYKGTILGLKPSRLYVRLDSPPIELKIYVEDLKRTCGYGYTLKEGECEMWPDDESEGLVLRLGDMISLRIEGFNQKRRRWSFVPVNVWKHRRVRDDR